MPVVQGSSAVLTMTPETKAKVVFLDRDGTINVDLGYVHRVEDWEFTRLACQALVLLSVAGFRIAVVTNQSGIATAMYTVDEVERLHAFMRQQLAQAGVELDAVVYCPHSQDGTCGCRKPRIGMAKLVEAELGRPIDYAASWTIGDKRSDIGFGKSLGTKTALIRSRYWSDAEVGPRPNMLVDSLFEAAQRIAAESKP